ncbi:MAG: hypothetical protein ABIW47_01595 [Ginsengibacter sp.]|jgi:hypothetical protein
MKYFLKPVLVILSALLIISCGSEQSTDEKTSIDSSQTTDSVKTLLPTNTKPVVDDTVAVKTLTKEILTSLKNNEYENLASYFHPGSGVRFSPYAYIDTSNDVRLSADEFTKAIKSNQKFTWGHADGSGDPIKLTIPEYFKKFVYNADFLSAEKTAVNKMIGGGNSINNLEKTYPDALFTENFDAGKHEMAWSSLRLVFKKEAGKFYLIGIVHDQWTI